MAFLSLIGLLILGGASGIYYLKKDSASGRLLIWKITATKALQQPITGYGFDTFQAKYPKAQAHYFQTGHGTSYEKQIAGNVKRPFNEPLQILFEYGFVGLLLFLGIIFLALFFHNRRDTNKETNGFQAIIVGIIIFSFFSYPFYSAPIALLFFIALGYISGQTKSIKLLGSVSQLLFIILAIAMSTLMLVRLPNLYHAYWLWDEAKTLYEMDNYQRANASFRQAYPYLQHNGEFLLNYSKNLYFTEDYTKALIIIKQGESLYTDEYYYITRGDIQKALGNPAEAEHNYKTAASIVPHKFYPLYCLAQLYTETKNNKKAVQTAHKILRKKVKIKSPAVQEIRQEMKELINDTLNTK